MKNIEKFENQDVSTPVDSGGFKLASGVGKLHTNNPESKNPKELLTIDWVGIKKLVDNPQSVDKEYAQWIIPSSLRSRSGKEQESHGEYWLLWADLDDDDKNTPPLNDVEKVVIAIIHDGYHAFDYELFSSKTAKLDIHKARILIPLKIPLNGSDWLICQQLLRSKLENCGIKSDPAVEKFAQISYLPNRGEFYQTLSNRSGLFFNPLEGWAKDIQDKRDDLIQQEKTLNEAKKIALQRRETLSLSSDTNQFKQLVSMFNSAYTPHDLMVAAGYDQRGNTFRHPNSKSGSYSATVRFDDTGVLRVHSLSTSDPLYSDGNGAHDSFSIFVNLNHNGDTSSALKYAGDNLLTIDGVPFNKAWQLKFKKSEVKPTQMHVPDYSDSERYKAVQNENVPLNVPPPKDNKTFKFADASELMARAYEPDFLIESLFETNSLGQIFGATGSGKSFVVLDMAYCIATGLDYHGLKTKQGNVAYICGEGFGAIGRRVKALQNKYKSDITGKLFISEQAGAFIDIGVTSDVAEAIKTIGNVNLVIIDTYHRNMGGGNENSADDFALVLRNIDTFLKPLNVAVIIIHHSGHGDDNRGRGSSSIRAAMDFEYQIKKSNDDVIMTPTKIKDGSTPPPIFFKLVDSELGFDKNGKPITSAYLESSEKGAVQSGTKRRLNAREDAVLQTLNDAIAKHGIDPTAEIKAKFGGFDSIVGRMQKIVHLDQWRELAYKVITIDDDGKDPAQALRKCFKRTREKLHDTGYIVVAGDYAWRIFDGSNG